MIDKDTLAMLAHYVAIGASGVLCLYGGEFVFTSLYAKVGETLELPLMFVVVFIALAIHLAISIACGAAIYASLGLGGDSDV